MNRASFKTWLDAQPDDALFGHESATCPIACYLKSLNSNWAPVSVGEFFIVIGGQTFRAPVWAQNFVQAFDQLSVRPWTWTSKTVALEALKAAL